MIVWNIFVTLSRSLFLVQVLLMYLCQTVSSLPASDIWFGPTLIHTSCICPLWYWRLCMLMIHNHSFRHTQNVSLQVALSTLSVIVFRSLSQKHTHTQTHKGFNQVNSFQLTGTQEVTWIHTLIRLPLCSHTHTAVTHTPNTLSQVSFTHRHMQCFYVLLVEHVPEHLPFFLCTSQKPETRK